MSEETVEIENTEQAAPPSERDYETEAKNLGWHNPDDDDFRGDPEKALGAKEFVEKGESEMPLLRANIKKLQKQTEEDRVSRDEFRSYMEGETDRQLKQQEAEFERRQREAARDGDVEAFDQIAKERKEAVPAQSAPVINNVEAMFKSRNDWYGDDIEKTMYAQGVSKIVLAQGSNQSQEEVFTKIEDAVKKKFARSTPRNTPPPSVEGGRKRPISDAAKTYAAMPQADRTACDRMAKKWGVDKKDFVKNYWADQEK